MAPPMLLMAKLFVVLALLVPMLTKRGYQYASRVLQEAPLPERKLRNVRSVLQVLIVQLVRLLV
jgi:hypothetical protein